MTKPQYPSEKLDQYMLRFPDGMRDRLKRMAAENGRSLNAQIIFMLEFALEEMELSARAYTNPDKRELTADHFRDEIRRAQSILLNVLADVEDPSSDLNSALREEIEEKTGVKQDPNSTPANRTIRGRAIRPGIEEDGED